MKLSAGEIKSLLTIAAGRDRTARMAAMDQLVADFWEAPVDYIRSRSKSVQQACSAILYRQKLKADFA